MTEGRFASGESRTLARLGLANYFAAAVVLLCCGVLCGVTGLTRWARNERSMRLGVALARPSVLPMLTVILLLIAGLAAFALLS